MSVKYEVWLSEVRRLMREDGCDARMIQRIEEPCLSIVDGEAWTIQYFKSGYSPSDAYDMAADGRLL